MNALTATEMGLAGSLRGLVSLPDVDELPKEAARKLAALPAEEWTEDDWLDLLKLQRIVRHNLAARHGLMAQTGGHKCTKCGEEHAACCGQCTRK